MKTKNEQQEDLREQIIEIPESTMDELSARLERLETELTEYSMKLHEENIKTMTDDEYTEKFAVYEEILALLNRRITDEKGFLDKVSVWIWIYAIVMFIMAFPTILYYTFSLTVLNLLMEPLILAGFPDVFIASLAVYTVPILMILLSWLLKLNVIKTKEDKKVFNIVWLIQSLIIAGGGIWAFFSVILYFI